MVMRFRRIDKGDLFIGGDRELGHEPFFYVERSSILGVVLCLHLAFVH